MVYHLRLSRTPRQVCRSGQLTDICSVNRGLRMTNQPYPSRRHFKPLSIASHTPKSPTERFSFHPEINVPSSILPLVAARRRLEPTLPDRAIYKREARSSNPSTSFSMIWSFSDNSGLKFVEIEMITSRKSFSRFFLNSW